MVVEIDLELIWYENRLHEVGMAKLEMAKGKRKKKDELLDCWAERPAGRWPIGPHAYGLGPPVRLHRSSIKKLEKLIF